MQLIENTNTLIKGDLIVLLNKGSHSLSDCPAESIFKIIKGNGSMTNLVLLSETNTVYDSIGIKFYGNLPRFRRAYKNEEKKWLKSHQRWYLIQTVSSAMWKI